MVGSTRDELTFKDSVNCIATQKRERHTLERVELLALVAGKRRTERYGISAWWDEWLTSSAHIESWGK